MKPALEVFRRSIFRFERSVGRKVYVADYVCHEIWDVYGAVSKSHLSLDASIKKEIAAASPGLWD